jgi:hypothetical protein
MPEIRYVCLSDTHLGAENSLLTNLSATNPLKTDPLSPSPILRSLVDCLRDLITRTTTSKKPTLILNGDVLELALTNVNEAAMVFERFVELCFPKDRDWLFDPTIYYVPGNHDHHLWEIAREAQYDAVISRRKPGEMLPVPWYSTNIFMQDDPRRVQANFLTHLVQRSEHLASVRIMSAYPNFGILNKELHRCAVFHHGHYIESIYRLMSTLRTMLFPQRKAPLDVWDIEAENYAWVDFFWSTLGRSGAVGLDVGHVYEVMQEPPAFDKLLDTLATSMTNAHGSHLAPIRIVEKGALKCLLERTVGRAAALEVRDTGQILSSDADRGLASYVEGPLHRQLLGELDLSVAPEMTFVFGHTHKPFETIRAFQGFPKPVQVLNTGGWVVDALQIESLHGAAVVLLDEHLNPASLRMYNESEAAGSNRVRVEGANPEKEAANSFVSYLRSLVRPNDPPWTEFSRRVGESIPQWKRNLQERITSRTTW